MRKLSFEQETRSDQDVVMIKETIGGLPFDFIIYDTRDSSQIEQFISDSSSSWVSISLVGFCECVRVLWFYVSVFL